MGLEPRLPRLQLLVLRRFRQVRHWGATATAMVRMEGALPAAIRRRHCSSSSSSRFPSRPACLIGSMVCKPGWCRCAFHSSPRSTGDVCPPAVLYCAVGRRRPCSTASKNSMLLHCFCGPRFPPKLPMQPAISWSCGCRCSPGACSKHVLPAPGAWLSRLRGSQQQNSWSPSLSLSPRSHPRCSGSDSGRRAHRLPSFLHAEAARPCPPWRATASFYMEAPIEQVPVRLRRLSSISAAVTGQNYPSPKPQRASWRRRPVRHAWRSMAATVSTFTEATRARVWHSERSRWSISKDKRR